MGSFFLTREVKCWVRQHFDAGVTLMGTKLYVGNLPYSITDAKLEELFSQYGNVRSAQVVKDRDTGRSKGFGFVEMEDSNDANAAINALNEKEHDGRPLTVNEARPREDRGGGGGGGGYRGGSRGGSGGGGGRGGYDRDRRY
jgi:RNA recognition motif-containing protein